MSETHTLTVEQAQASFLSEEFSRLIADLTERLATSRVARAQLEQALNNANLEAHNLREDNDRLRAEVLGLQEELGHLSAPVLNLGEGDEPSRG